MYFCEVSSRFVLIWASYSDLSFLPWMYIYLWKVGRLNGSKFKLPTNKASKITPKPKPGKDIPKKPWPHKFPTCQLPLFPHILRATLSKRQILKFFCRGTMLGKTAPAPRLPSSNTPLGTGKFWRTCVGRWWGRFCTAMRAKEKPRRVLTVLFQHFFASFSGYLLVESLKKDYVSKVM